MADKSANGRTVEAAAPATLPEQQAQSSEDVGARNGTVEQDQKPTVQQDPIFQRWESVGRADTWKTGKGSELEAYSGSFGPWPEEVLTEPFFE